MNGTQIVEIAIGLVEVATIRRKSVARRTAKKEIHRLVAKAIQRKQFGDTEQKLTKSLTPFFAKQIQSARKELDELKSTGLTEKQSNAAVNLAKMIFNPREWDRELVDRSLPVVAEAMIEGAVSTLAMVGVDLRKSVSKGRKPKRYNIPVDSPIGRVVAAGGRFGGIKASTASEWLEQEGIGPPLEVLTEYPQWLQREISSGLRETFEQEYWDEINDTTLMRLETYLDKGLRDGWSISKMAANMTSIMGPEYSKARATNVARTESGNALNAGRDASIRGVQEAVGPEAAPQIGKGWLSVLGNTTRDTHADTDGQLADADGNFILAGYTIPWPSHYSLPARERCHCQCTITMELGVGMPEDQLQAALGELEEPKLEEPKPVFPLEERGDGRVIRELSDINDVPKAIEESGNRIAQEASVNSDLRESIKDYTDSQYAILNYNLRHGVKDDAFKVMTEHLDSITMHSLSEPVTTYRGVGKSGKKFLGNAKKMLKEGGVIEDLGFMSTSLEPNLAAGFAEESNILLQVRTSKGAYLEPVTEISGEMEMLLPRNTKYRVLGIDKKVTIGVPGVEPEVYSVIRLEAL